MFIYEIVLETRVSYNWNRSSQYSSIVSDSWGAVNVGTINTGSIWVSRVGLNSGVSIRRSNIR